MSIVQPELVAAIFAGDTTALDCALSDDVVFHSPVRSYPRRDDVLHLLSMVGALLPDARAARRWQGDGGAATFFVSEQAEGTLSGVIEERHDADGRIRELTLMLRPIRVMMPTVKRMGAALEANPLPSG
jgi:hypothetical protein